MPDPKTYFAPEPETPPLEEGDDGGCGDGPYCKPSITGWHHSCGSRKEPITDEEFKANLGAEFLVKFELYQADQRRLRERQQSKQEDVS